MAIALLNNLQTQVSLKALTQLVKEPVVVASYCLKNVLRLLRS